MFLRVHRLAAHVMPGTPHNLVDLRRMLAERFPAAHAVRPARDGVVWPTGVPGFDGFLRGLPAGEITEVVGDGPGSGSAQLVHALLARTAADGRFLALVDGADSFDVDAADPKVLSRLLWVRCRTVDEALKATDLLLRDRNVPLVILDLKANPVSQLRKVPSSAWHRYGRIAEHHGTTLLVVTPFAMVGATALRVEMRAGLGWEDREDGPAAVAARLRIRVVRAAEESAGERAAAG